MDIPTKVGHRRNAIGAQLQVVCHYESTSRSRG